MAPPVEVLKSPADRKEYRYVSLANGLQVLLIHDPEVAAAVAAAAAGAAGAEGGAEVCAPRGCRGRVRLCCVQGGCHNVSAGAAAAQRGERQRALLSPRGCRRRLEEEAHTLGHHFEHYTCPHLRLHVYNTYAPKIPARQDAEMASGDASASASGSDAMSGSEEDEGESDEGEEGEEGEDEGESMSGDDSGSGSEDGSSGSDEGEEEEGEEGGGKRRGGAPAPAASKKAAAAMAVGVGSFSDPAQLQGLSHYLEHMLFMGR